MPDIKLKIAIAGYGHTAALKDGGVRIDGVAPEFVEVAPGVEGLCHKSEIPTMADRGQTGDALLPVGEEYDFKIIKLNETERKIGLSLRAVAEEEERTRLEDYQRQAAAATMTIEEAMNIRGKGEGR